MLGLVFLNVADRKNTCIREQDRKTGKSEKLGEAGKLEVHFATSFEGTNARIEEKSEDEVSVGKEAMNPPLSLERSYVRMHIGAGGTHSILGRIRAEDDSRRLKRRRIPLVCASSCAL